MKKNPKAASKGEKRIRQKKNVTLSPRAIAMGAALAEFEGVKFSQLVERWTREAFRHARIPMKEEEADLNT